MKKFDKEYRTQFSPEKEFLLSVGIKPTFIRIVCQESRGFSHERFKKND